MTFSDIFGCQPYGWLALEASLTILFIGFLDFYTGYEVSLSILYAVPIYVVAWYCDKKNAILVALIGGLTWWWANIKNGHAYWESWHEGWETFVRLAFFIFVAIGAAALRAQRDAAQARITLLEQTHRLEREIIRISEREQQRIGQDLHDGLCQYLAALGCAAASLKNDLEQRDLNKEAGSADELAILLGDAVVQTRNLARGLVPLQIEEAGLASSLNELAHSITRLLGVNCTFETYGQLPQISNASGIHLYRIAQEAINNATKHGHARNITISLRQTGRMLLLNVVDDGAGISETKSQGGGMGLNIMNYRARLAGGDLRIESTPNGGTLISCRIWAKMEELDEDAA